MRSRPERDEWLMRLAVVVSTRGTCNRGQVGAIISREGRIISTGYVGAPAGLAHCTDVGCSLGLNGGCSRTVHAEANAIAFAARFGTATDGAELHCTHAPCDSCAKSIINSGISRVVYEHPYRLTEGLELLDRAGLAVVQLNPHGASPDEVSGDEGDWPQTVNVVRGDKNLHQLGWMPGLCSRGKNHDGPCNGYPMFDHPGFSFGSGLEHD